MDRQKNKLPKEAKLPLVSPAEWIDPEEENFQRLELQENDDGEYQAMLKSVPTKKRKLNTYFEKNERYRSSTNPQEVEQPEEKDNLGGLLPIKQALKELKNQRKQKSKLLSEQIKQIDDEDEEFENIGKGMKTSEQSIEQSIHLKNQLNIYSSLVDVRYSQQNELQNMKRFPKRNFPFCRELNEESKHLEMSLIRNIDLILSIYTQYADKVLDATLKPTPSFSHSISEEEATKQVSRSDCKINMQSFYETFLQTTQQISKETQKQLVKWSQKTTLLNRTTNSAQYSSLMMQTAVGQAKKAISNWDRVQNKCQQKRSTFRILFEPSQNARQTTDKQIYDDLQLFGEIEKVYVNEVEEDNQFRTGDTLKYLRNRETNSNRKDVDRRASKNRKIRFNVHPKLLNFMPSALSSEIEARNQIVTNLFNCKPKDTAREEIEYIDM